MVNLYVQPNEIRSYLGVDADKYDDTRLQMLIEMKMDYIDKITRITWNSNRRLAKEYHDLTTQWFRGGMLFGNGIPVYLSYMNIQKFNKIEIQMLSSSYSIESQPEGRNYGQWWADYSMGILYIVNFIFYQGGKELYVEYVYGRDDLPGAIKEWCLLLVVKDLILNERFVWTMEAGSNNSMSYTDYLKYIDEKIIEIEKEYRPILPAYVASRVENYYIE